jgi:hypothetical protein
MKRLYENLNTTGNVRASLTQTSTHHLNLFKPLYSWIYKFNRALSRAEQTIESDEISYIFGFSTSQFSPQKFKLCVVIELEQLVFSLYKLRGDKWIRHSLSQEMQEIDRVKYRILNDLIDKEIQLCQVTTHLQEHGT